jgi:RHH-type proline utilization regulon transcriptional repressor/proline dehydrogenase/delta 1-pyrroline-5-carboxylate dehydrogenase
MLLTPSQIDRHTSVSEKRAAVRAAHRMDEPTCVEQRLSQVGLTAQARDRIEERARGLVGTVREQRVRSSGIDAFMHEYELSSKEGVVLMCLAEALLRIPDAETADALIKDKIGDANWEAHLGHSESWFVNASTWALMLTGQVVNLDGRSNGDDWRNVMRKLVHRSGEPVIRQAVTQAMRVMGRQFVMGRTIGEALERAESFEKRGYRYSYDMLGEAARTMADADRYFDSYADAIERIGVKARGRGPIEAPGISVKLSALHPRYEFGQEERVLKELVPRLIDLCRKAKHHDIGLCVDAEEADRLDLSMDALIAAVTEPSLKDWDGLGLAVQAYQKRAYPLVDWLADLARRGKKRLLVRLVKGAYWDTEVKRAQELGLSDYPVFTRKVSTDVSYLACARKLLDEQDAFYPCFATHNAHTVAAVAEMAGNRADFEYQRLHGMGDALYDRVVGKDGAGRPVRIYAPVGGHEDLLAYLVRRLTGERREFQLREPDRGRETADRGDHRRSPARGRAPRPGAAPANPDAVGSVRGRTAKLGRSRHHRSVHHRPNGEGDGGSRGRVLARRSVGRGRARRRPTPEGRFPREYRPDHRRGDRGRRRSRADGFRAGAARSTVVG